MNINKILKLNTKFYQSIGKEFSKSRQYPWKGWKNIVDILREKFSKNSFSVLDIGCGNGRFYKFLRTSHFNFEYLGLDNSRKLFPISFEKFKNVNFKVIDIFRDLNKVDKTYDVVVGFGVTHHVPNDKDFRDNWFERVGNLVNKDGLLILSFWNFEKESGDYLVSWDNKPKTPRYCHQYSKQELENIKELYKSKGFKLVKEYEEDNKNLYLIFMLES